MVTDLYDFLRLKEPYWAQRKMRILLGSRTLKRAIFALLLLRALMDLRWYMLLLLNLLFFFHTQLLFPVNIFNFFFQILTFNHFLKNLLFLLDYRQLLFLSLHWCFHILCLRFRRKQPIIKITLNIFWINLIIRLIILFIHLWTRRINTIITCVSYQSVYISWKILNYSWGVNLNTVSLLIQK